jgi:hypothetical protein
MEAYYNAIAQQDARLAAQAQEEGQRQLAFGTTLFGTGADLLGGYQRGLVGSLDPFRGYLGAASDIESLGQQPLELGAALGGRIANPAGGQALLTGGIGAAQTMQAANALNPTASFLQGLSTNQDLTSAIAKNLFSGRPAYSSFNENVPGNFPTTYFTPNPNARNQGYGYY